MLSNVLIQDFLKIALKLALLGPFIACKHGTDNKDLILK